MSGRDRRVGWEKEAGAEGERECGGLAEYAGDSELHVVWDVDQTKLVGEGTNDVELVRPSSSNSSHPRSRLSSLSLLLLLLIPASSSSPPASASSSCSPCRLSPVGCLRLSEAHEECARCSGQSKRVCACAREGDRECAVWGGR